MKLRLFLAIFAAAVSVVSLILMLIFIDPLQTDSFLINLFYVCLFTAVAGIFFLFGILLRKRIPQSIRLSVSFRQAMFLAAIIASLLIMKDFNILRLWNGLILVGGVIGAEMYFSYK